MLGRERRHGLTIRTATDAATASALVAVMLRFVAHDLAHVLDTAAVLFLFGFLCDVAARAGIDFNAATPLALFGLGNNLAAFAGVNLATEGFVSCSHWGIPFIAAGRSTVSGY